MVRAKLPANKKGDGDSDNIWKDEGSSSKRTPKVKRTTTKRAIAARSVLEDMRKMRKKSKNKGKRKKSVRDLDSKEEIVAEEETEELDFSCDIYLEGLSKERDPS